VTLIERATINEELFVISYSLSGNDSRIIRLIAGKPEGLNAGMPEAQRVFGPPSLPAS
jgi:hypothetical protein